MSTSLPALTSVDVARPQQPRGGRGAFTIIELIIVILVIAIVISIVAPMLGHTRVIAREAASNAMLLEVVKAGQQFRTDNNRWPGVFSAREMGDTANINSGLSQMQNAMLELAGGFSDSNPANPLGTVLQIGPGGQAQDVFVDLGAIGMPGAAGNKGYYRPDAKFFVAQDGIVGGQAQASGDNDDLPVLVDHFGTPVLLWSEDETAPSQVTQVADFARVDTSAGPARFYVASNAAHIFSSRLGTLGRSQADTTNAKGFSLLAVAGQGSGAEEDASPALAGLLGDPSRPVAVYLPGSNNMAAWPALPAAPRGGFVVHSAARDGVYMSSRSRRASQYGSDALNYGRNFWTDVKGTTPPQNRHLDDKGSPTTIDVLDDFDDLVIHSGG